MKFVPCITWIRRGVSVEMPEKVRLSKDELKELFDSEKDAENLTGESDVEEDEDVVATGETEETKGAERMDEDLSRYHLDEYDEEEEDKTSSSAAGLKSLLCFSSNDDDPYITVVDEEDESDIEDIVVKPDDNIIAIGLVDEDSNSVEFHIYNEDENEFFAHHDILLPTMPLCMEWLDYEADDEDGPKKGNFLAVGGMSPAIEVWDVDVVDCLEPAFTLGSSKKKKNIKRGGHTDAVLDLSWNFHVRNILASGSADFTVCLWDMSNRNVVSTLKHCTEKVQSLKWHPYEMQHLLIGSCDELMTLVDCRDPDSVAKTWKCDGEVEKVLWNHFNPFHCLASTDKGFVHCVDARTDSILWTLSAHPASCSGLCLSSQCPGFMATASVDERIKVWDISNDAPTFVHEVKFKLGKLYSLAASPDSPFMVCAGGDHKSHNYKLIDLMSYSPVQKRFNDRELILPKVDEDTEMSAQNESSVMAMEALNLSEVKLPSSDLPEVELPSPGKSKKKKKSKKKHRDE